MTKFRVGVVTILEVDAVDFNDAANIAENAVGRALLAADANNDTIQPVQIRWQHYNHHFYEATVTQMPVELARVLLNQHVTLTVPQPTREETNGVS